jgi:uncharacterized protein (DUF1800 family)
MDRRDFVTLDTKPEKKKQDFSHLYRTQSGLTPYTASWTIADVRHLLKRTMFGATKSDIDFFLSLNLNDAVDTLVELINHPPYTPPSPPVNNYDLLLSDPNCPAGQPWPGTPDTNTINIYTYSYRQKSMKDWWVSQMLFQPRSLREKMVLFFSNHFVIEFDTVTVSTYIYKYNQLLRQYALGNLKALTKEVTINSAMLVYLNGDENTDAAPNENYGRELQELFTVGKDATGNPFYTEDDVKAAARVLTGWKNDLVAGTTSANGFNSLFNPAKHDSTDKVFSQYYNNTIIVGQSGANGALEADDLMDMIFSKDEVSLNLCRKLYRFFVYYDIDAATENNVIAPLSAIMRANNYEMAPVLAALFKSEHFFDVLNRGCMIKSPIDLTAGLCREFNVVFPDSTNLPGQYSAWDRVRNISNSTLMEIGDPPNVAGWPAYYQAPSYHEMWINSDTLPKRNKFTDRMTNNGYTSNGATVIIDVLAYTSSLTNPSDPIALIDEVLALHYSIDVSVNVKNYLLSILLSGQASNAYWSNAWDDYTNDPTNASYIAIVESRLKSFYRYIMDLSEYQLA